MTVSGTRMRSGARISRRIQISASGVRVPRSERVSYIARLTKRSRNLHSITGGHAKIIDVARFERDTLKRSNALPQLRSRVSNFWIARAARCERALAVGERTIGGAPQQYYVSRQHGKYVGARVVSRQAPAAASTRRDQVFVWRYKRRVFVAVSRARLYSPLDFDAERWGSPTTLRTRRTAGIRISARS